MAIRFVIGRAGSGKTHHCLTAIQNRLREDPIDGRRLIMLVPEQAALQVERTLLAPEDVSAAHRADVLSFRRLAFRVAEGTGWADRSALTETARTMVLRHLFAQNAGEMKYYRMGGGIGGLVEHLSGSIAELIQESVEPEALLALSDSDAAGTLSQRAKLHDLGLIFGAYLQFLGEDRVDPSQLLALARGEFAQCDWIGGAEVWVDGFASLAQLEVEALIELARLCHSLEITLLADADRLHEPPTSSSGLDLSVFRKIHRTYADLHRACVQADLDILDPLRLNPASLPRFSRSPALAAAEAALARGSVGRASPPGACGAKTDESDDKGKQASNTLRIVALPSQRCEAEYAVALLCGLVHRSDAVLRYKDVAIIARTLEPYHELLTEALTARRIPFFIDQRRTTAHHALPELLRSLLDLAARGFSMEDVRGSLKTGLWPLDRDPIDALDSYLIAQGINGFHRWARGRWPRATAGAMTENRAPKEHERAALQAIETTRQRIHDLIAPWMEAASHRKRKTGAAWAQSLRDVIERLGVEATLKQWADEAERGGRPNEAAEHRQIQRDCQALLDEFASAFEAIPLGLSDVQDAMESGLKSLTLGLTPPTVDQVLIGSIERSRHPEIKVAIVIGFNDGVFPTYAGEDPILNDLDRALLNGHGIHVRPPSRQRTLDEPLLAYIAATRASEQLIITYATSDAEGKALRPSPTIESLLGDLPGTKIEAMAGAEPTRATWDIQTAADLSRRLVSEFREREAKPRGFSPVRGVWNRLYEQTRETLANNPIARSMFRGLMPAPPATLSKSSVDSAYQGRFHASVSQLERYAACPFKHFASSVLRLTEQAEAALAPTDTGTIQHAILEDFVKRLIRDQQSFQRIDEAQLRNRVAESCQQVGNRLRRERLESQSRDRYRLRRCATQLTRILLAQRQISMGTRFAPRATELAFGFDRPESLPALTLSTPAGRSIGLRGFVDRVDVALVGQEHLGVVIDYKTTRDKRLDLSEVCHGLSLQLLAYLLALESHGSALTDHPITPIAALYVSLRHGRKPLAHPSEQKARDAEFPKSLKPRGLIRSDKFDFLEPRGEASGDARYYSIYRKKKDGACGKLNNTDAAPEPVFRGALAHTQRQLGRLADGILDGNIAVRPCRHGDFSPCTWCALKSVCRFEMGIDPIQSLTKLTRSQALDLLEAASGDG